MDRQPVGARRAAEPEVDASRVQRLERAELLGDHDRRVVREHDPAGADPDRLRAARDVGDHDGGRGARDPDGVVVLGEPEAVVAPALGVLGQVERVPERVARRRALDDRRQVENREGRQGHAPQSADSTAASRIRPFKSPVARTVWSPLNQRIPRYGENHLARFTEVMTEEMNN